MKNELFRNKLLKITLLYFFVSFIYIFFSDRAAHTLVSDQKTLRLTQDFLGILYIIITVLIIYFSIYLELKKQMKIGSKLKERNEFLHLIFENSSTGIVIFNWDDEFIQVNQAVCELLDYDKDELLERSFLSVIFEKHRHSLREKIESLKSGQNRYFEIECKFLRKDWKTVWISMYVSLMPVESGNKPMLLAMVSDIQDRKINEQNRMEQQLLFETMFNSINDGVLISSNRRAILHANKGMKKTFGYDPEELIGLSAQILYADKKIYDDVGKALFSVDKNHEDYLKLVNCKRKDGQIFPGELYGTQLFDYAGNSIGNLVIIRDITDRIDIIRDLKQTNMELLALEENLRQSNKELNEANIQLRKREVDLENSSRFFEQLLMQSATSTQLFNPEGWCVRINTKHSELFDVRPEELEGRKYNILHDNDLKQNGVAEKIIRVFDRFETVSWNSEIDYKGAGRSEKNSIDEQQKRFLFNKAYPILDREGKLENVIIQHMDITEVKEVEYQIMKAVINAEELERKRISMDLHDGIGPLLSTAKLYFQTYIKSGKEDLRRNISNQLIDTLNEAIDQVSNISNTLSPRMLSDFGLEKALHRFVDRVKSLSGISINLEINLPKEMKNEIELTIFRVSLELINNTLKHAEAGEIFMHYTVDHSIAKLRFENDGRYFDFNTTMKESRGMGLINMTQRINSLGGELHFSTRIPAGIVYDISLPL